MKQGNNGSATDPLTHPRKGARDARLSPLGSFIFHFYAGFGEHFVK